MRKYFIIVGVVLLAIGMSAGVSWWTAKRAEDKAAADQAAEDDAILARLEAAAARIHAEARADRIRRNTKPVRVERPVRGELVATVTVHGTARPKTRVVVSTRTAGVIAELPCRVGDRVSAGGDGAKPSVLVTLDPRKVNLALREAENQVALKIAETKVHQADITSKDGTVATSESLLAEATRELTRQKKLLASGDASQLSYDQAANYVEKFATQLKVAKVEIRLLQSRLAACKGQLAQANAAVAQAKDQLKRTTIVSPINGTVLAVKANAFEPVVPGRAIVEVADLTRMLVVASVAKRDVPAIAVGQPATVAAKTGMERTFAGTVESVTMDSVTIEILTDARTPPILPGLFAQAVIETERRPNVLRVPTQAVLLRAVAELPTEISEDNPAIDPDEPFATVVYRRVDGKAVVTPVTAGPVEGARTVIRTGLTDDDYVITGPGPTLLQLKHDQNVRPEEHPATTDAAD